MEIARQKFQYERSTAVLVMDSDGTAVLKSVYSAVKRQGYATELMKLVVNYLDTKNLVCFLEARAYGQPGVGLNNRALMVFYEKFGFERETGQGVFRGIWMFRVPLALREVKEKTDEKIL